ncbi:MAG: VOC family protein [Candidatus Micrarchaeota archaeon]
MRFNRLIPELSVSDFNRSLNFYTGVLSFKVEYKRKDFAFLSLQGSQIMIEKMNDTWSTAALEHPFGRGINLQIEVDDVDGLVKCLQENDYPIFRMPQDNWYEKNHVLLGSKEFLVQDPDGYLLRFAQAMGTRKKNQTNLRLPIR